MWVITPMGFFSIVQKFEDREHERVSVRGRVKDDLINLRHYLIENGAEDVSGIIITYNSDYMYRIIVSQSEMADCMADMVEDINYSNFKDEVKAVQGKERADTYMRIWAVLEALQPRTRKWLGDWGDYFFQKYGDRFKTHAVGAGSTDQEYFQEHVSDEELVEMMGSDLEDKDPPKLLAAPLSDDDIELQEYLLREGLTGKKEPDDGE